MSDRIDSQNLQVSCSKLQVSCNQLATDYISRQAAIDSIQYAGKIGKQTCIGILKRLPSAEQRWIPVSERLPNRYEFIKNNGLFNVSDGDRSYSEWFDICDKQMFGELTTSGFRVDYAVVAWMPLPEPYRREE